ncbi:peptidoglycan-binding protein [Nonomuraea cavernae]|uniref:peptidoglycan-binding protein n=1 Tax=Nonomuraea cavernae TaxID=2045107 RepID=UPI0033EEBB73
MKRRLALLGAVVAGCAVVALVATRDDAAPVSASTAAPAGTADITRSDLVDHKAVPGTLGYAERRALPNQARGVITKTRPEGAVIRRCGWIYEVAGKPVLLMYGETPIYRQMSQGTTGKDVKQLETNLKALGHDPGKVDNTFTAETAKAVKAWQGKSGLGRTGRVDGSQVIVATGPIRIAEMTGAKGDPAGRSAVTATGTRLIVHIDLAATSQHLARLEAKVDLESLTGDQATGRVTSIGSVARQPERPGGEPTIDVEVSLDGELKGFDQAPVSVSMRSEVRPGVLSVPVEALLALREGGYGVRVVEGAGKRIAKVRTGMFASGRVEITGDRLQPGMKVEVPGD